MKRIIQICAICILVLAGACKKENNDALIPESETPIVSTPTIIADNQNVYQLEIVTLTSSNISFNQPTYSGTFASQTVTLTVLDNILGFQIPAVTAGTYTLQTSIEGNNYSFIYNVQVLPTISNPSTYVQNAVDGIMHSTTQVSNLTSAMSNMYGASDRTANNTIVNNYYTNFQNAFNSATSQEKIDLAKFVAANPILFSPAEDLISFIDSLNGFKVATGNSIEDKWNSLDTEVKNRVRVITKIGIASVAGFATGNPLFGTLAGLYGVKKIYDLNIYLINELDKNLLQFGNTLLTDVQKTATPTTEFENGQEYTFEIKANYRNLNQQDVNSNSSLIKSIVSSLNSFGNVWNKVMSVVPTSLVGGSFHISNVTTSHQKTFKVNAPYLSIANISNPNVTTIINTASGAFKVKFNTTQTTNQVFNFDIKYTNPNVNTTLSTNTGTVLSSGNYFKIDATNYLINEMGVEYIQNAPQDPPSYSHVNINSLSIVNNDSTTLVLIFDTYTTLPTAGTYTIRPIATGTVNNIPQQFMGNAMIIYDEFNFEHDFTGIVNVTTVNGKTKCVFSNLTSLSSGKNISGNFITP